MAFVIAEIVGGLIFNSMSLLTDAGHNLSDVASLFLSLLAFKMAAKKSSPVYTYGYKKTHHIGSSGQCSYIIYCDRHFRS